MLSLKIRLHELLNANTTIVIDLLRVNCRKIKTNELLSESMLKAKNTLENQKMYKVTLSVILLLLFNLRELINVH